MIKVPDEYEVPLRPFADVPLEQHSFRTRVFVQQRWSIHPYGKEIVFAEDGVMLEDSDRFGPDRPSLYREHRIQVRYMDLLFNLRRIVDEREGSESAFVDLLQSAQTANRVEELLVKHERLVNGSLDERL